MFQKWDTPMVTKMYVDSRCIQWCAYLTIPQKGNRALIYQNPNDQYSKGKRVRKFCLGKNIQYVY